MLLSLSPKAKETKAKINKSDLIKPAFLFQERKAPIKQKDDSRNGRKYLNDIGYVVICNIEAAFMKKIK